MDGASQRSPEVRWGRRAGLARTVRILVFLVPVAAASGVAYLVAQAMPTASTLGGRAAALLVLAAVSTGILVLLDRLMRKALPLATLLDLSMLFPDAAPSRIRMARAAISRVPIEEQLARVRRAGADPGTVAREILTLVAALSAHDRPTRGHAERVRMFTDLLAEALNVPERARDLLRWAAILHDVGKLRVPASLLNKPGKPTEDEWVTLRAHPTHGAEIAAALVPWLGEWGAVILEHHERYDGTGYPRGIAGKQISFGARIVSVADVYDVMTAARAYRRPVSRAAACRELVRFSGSQFDPAVVRAMVSMSAPRLRRAQGVLAFLADIPLVASNAVPAATLARVVGAGALATGAVAAVPGFAAAQPTPAPQSQNIEAAVGGAATPLPSPRTAGAPSSPSTATAVPAPQPTTSTTRQAASSVATGPSTDSSSTGSGASSDGARRAGSPAPATSTSSTPVSTAVTSSAPSSASPAAPATSPPPVATPTATAPAPLPTPATTSGAVAAATTAVGAATAAAGAAVSAATGAASAAAAPVASTVAKVTGPLANTGNGQGRQSNQQGTN